MSLADGRVWCYSLEEDEGWGDLGDEYATRDEAEAFAKSDDEIPPGSTFYTGKQEKSLPSLDGEQICEMVGEAAIEELGEELVEDWLDQAYLSTKLGDDRDAEMEALGKSLTEVFHRWLDENKLMPDFYTVVEVQKHKKAL